MYIYNPDKKISLDIFVEEKFITNLKSDYYLYFICRRCNKETRRQGSQYKKTLNVDYKKIPIDKDDLFLCMVCYNEKNMIKKYGVKNVFQLKDIKEKNNKKYKEKRLIKYGYDLNNTDSINFKCEKCGVEISKTFYRYKKNKLCRSCSSVSKNEDEKINLLIERLKEDITPLFSKEEYSGVRKKGVNILYRFKCNKCGDEFTDHFHSNIPHCKKCMNYGFSIKEKEIASFLVSKNIEISENNTTEISPKEIDIYVPSKKLGIEFNGLIWHSSKFGKNKFYHLDKTKLANSAGIALIHIFEDEWDNKKEIVKSILLTKFNKFETIYQARKTIIKKVSLNEEKDFLEKNHIQGYAISSVCYGAFYNNELISLMSFVKSRFNKKYEWELLRFANKTNTTTIGGPSKLFKTFIREYNPNNIISYCDLRYFTGTLYEKIGMSFSHISKPNYFYCKDRIRYSRISFQKHKLRNILPIYNSLLTEEENMKNNNYYKIWDCGNKVFTWSKL